MTRLLVLAALSPLLAVACASSSSDSTCDLSAELRARAGSAPTDCGYAALGGDAAAVDTCVAGAFNSGQAFVARYDRHGIDSKVVFGVAGDAQGNVVFLLYDGDPSGGSGAHPAVTADQCVGPALDASSSRDPFVEAPFTCTSTASLGRICG